MNRARLVLALVVGVGAASLITAAAVAHCGRCKGSAKDMCRLLDDGKMTLARAIEIAEKHCKGRAVAAHCEMEGSTLEIGVYCLAGDKIVEVELDHTGKVTETEEKKQLPGKHDDHKH
jgi:heterodisulfide reductase subunit B